MAAVLACARVRRDLRLVGRDRGDDHRGRAARDAAPRLFGRLATGTLAAGGTLGILIPPSVPLVIYAILPSRTSPSCSPRRWCRGIIAMLGYMLAIAIYVRLVPGHAPEVDDDAAPADLARCSAASRRSRSSSSSSSAASTAACSRRPKAPRSAPPRPSSPRSLKREITWAKFKHCFYATAQSVGDDLPDLHRRRPDELGARADAGAGAARRASSTAGACRR